MNRKHQPDRRRSTPFRLGGAALACLLAGSAWAGDDAAAGSNSDGVWGTVLDTLDLRTKVGPMPGFVEATRPDPSRLKYIPTSTPHPKRSVPVKSADQVEAAKQALDAARDAQLNPAPPTPALASRKHRPAKPKQAADKN